jgi:hypothetical protein
MVKENDGKRARKDLTRKILIILAAFGTVIFVVYWVRERPKNFERKRKQQQINHSQVKLGGSPISERLRRRIPFGDSAWNPDKKVLDDIIHGRLTLSSLHIDQTAIGNSRDDGYQGVYAQFCKVDWSSHKEDPALTPMFRDTANVNPDCKRPHTLDLNNVAKAARAFDERNAASESPKVLENPLFVFHESRCGSTLVANLLQVTSPIEHRVYSEHPGPLLALQACGESYKTCSFETAVSIFADTIYLMSRTDDSRETRAFFKIQSIGSKHIPVFQRAFPDTPWIYVYREGVEVMMSHLSQGTKHALCVNSRHNPGRTVEELAQRHHVTIASLSNVEYCALHLSALIESAAESLNEYAIPVNYRDLPDVLYEKILPAIGIPVGEAEIHRIEHAAQTYAKGSRGRYQDFKGDTEKKELAASEEIKDAAAKFLAPAFEELEVAAAQRKKKIYAMLE